MPTAAAYLKVERFAGLMRHRDEPITMVAGAATGTIGRAVAERLAAAGHRLALVDRRTKELRALAEALAGDAESVRVQTGDILQPRRVRHFVDDMLIHYGRVDNVVFAPDDVGFGGFTETSEVELEAHLDVSLRGPWYWMHAALPSMIEHEGGRFVFVTAEPAGGLAAAPRGAVAYAAAKGALRALVREVRAEYADHLVRPVCLVVRGPVDTPAYRSALDPEAWGPAVSLARIAHAVQDILQTDLEDLPPEVRLEAADA